MITMYTSSGRSDPITAGPDFGPFLTVIIALCLFPFAFPAWLFGFLLHRYLQRFLTRRICLLIWLSLSGLAVISLAFQSYFVLYDLITRQLNTYILADARYQLNILSWPWGALWDATWPIWLQTLVGIPIVALLQYLVASTRGSRTAHLLHEIAQRRKLRVARALQRAKEEQMQAAWRSRYSGLLNETYELLGYLSTVTNNSLAERVASQILAERTSARGEMADEAKKDSLHQMNPPHALSLL